MRSRRRLFVHNINVPVFLAGAAQDEQVGGYCSTMLGKFTGTDKVHVTLVNGSHTEPLIPAIFHRWMEFLWIYVRNETPADPGGRADHRSTCVSGVIVTSSGLTLPPDRFTGMTYEEAKAAFEAEPPVRVLFESGAGDAPIPVRPFPASSTASPLGRCRAFAADGATTSASDGALRHRPEPTDRATTSIPSSTTRRARSRRTISVAATASGRRCRSGTGSRCRMARRWHYASQPLTEDLVMVGSGSVDLVDPLSRAPPTSICR